jgi:hypothetical protein
MPETKTETIQQTIARLERFVERFERRYEMKSDAMLDLVRTGRFKETAEIGQWLMTYRRLNEFKSRRKGGAPTGTRSIAI